MFSPRVPRQLEANRFSRALGAARAAGRDLIDLTISNPTGAGIVYPTFDDTDPNRYWSAANPLGSTKVAGSGTVLTVTKTRDGGDELQVKVTFK